MLRFASVHVHLTEQEKRALATQEPFNFGLEAKHAGHFRNVRSGLKGISVIHLPKGLEVYRFNTAGRSAGGWWTTHDVLLAIQAYAAAGGMHEALAGRKASAVLADWNKCNELLCATVNQSCMAFTGVGVPQTEVIPFTNMRIIYEKCREIPQVYIPNSHWLDQSIRNERLISHRVVKTFADHDACPTLGNHRTLGEVERQIKGSTKSYAQLNQPLTDELRHVESRIPTASGQMKIQLQRRKKELLAALKALRG